MTLFKKNPAKWPLVQAMAKLPKLRWCGTSAVSTKIVSLLMSEQRIIQKRGNRQTSVTAPRKTWVTVDFVVLKKMYLFKCILHLPRPVRQLLKNERGENKDDAENDRLRTG